MKKIRIYPLICLLFLFGAFDILAKAPIGNKVDVKEVKDSNLALSPQPITVDRVIHNRGNIALNIDNWGYIGGYNYYLPSMEYPRNSGHDYLAESLFWMGAIKANGDTVVANTMDDFQGMTMPNNDSDKYLIYLSTDTSRYYNYVESDLTGLATGRPAYGWRVWEDSIQDYDYNQSYNSLSASFVQTGPTSQQDSHYRFNDAASGQSVLGLELTQTIYQWNYCYNEDFMFVQLDITNTSSEDYAEFAFGLYVDPDIGGDDGVGGNGNLEDLLVYDTALNYAYLYDVQNYDPGWDTATGVMGTVFLETPNDIGVTAVRTDDWSYLPDTDAKRFEMINSAQYDTPLPPTDQFYVQCVRGIPLYADSTIRVVFALVAGDDAADFVDNAAMAQQLYDSYFIGPEPPVLPTLSSNGRDGKVYLSWNDTSEASIDPMNGETDFAGYKLYRSDNQGRSWGIVNYDNDNTCLGTDYYPLATYRALNPGDPIAHSFVDKELYNGVEYWYCLAAFDKGDSVAGVDVLQNGFGIAGEVSNIVAVTPRSNPAGFYEASTTVEHIYTGTATKSDGEVVPIIFDESALTASEYKVVFEETDTELLWHILNATTGDTILANQSVFNNDIDKAELADGLQVLVVNADNEPKNMAQTAFAGSDSTLQIHSFYGPTMVYWFGDESYAFAPAQYRAAYELRYSTDSTMAISMWEGYDEVSYPQTPVPFEVWNTTTNQRVSLAMDEWPIDGVWAPNEDLIIVDRSYDPAGDLTSVAYPYYFGWRFSFEEAVFAPVAGDVFTFEGNGANGPDDEFVFKVSGVNANTAGNELKDIKVVPNPYLVKNSSLVETDSERSKIYFNNLPEVCTIRVYSLDGTLVKTIEHYSGGGSEPWNLLTDNNHQISSGTYIYHVDSEFGEFLGRMAIVK